MNENYKNNMKFRVWSPQFSFNSILFIARLGGWFSVAQQADGGGGALWRSLHDWAERGKGPGSAPTLRPSRQAEYQGVHKRVCGIEPTSGW